MLKTREIHFVVQKSIGVFSWRNFAYYCVKRGIFSEENGAKIIPASIVKIMGYFLWEKYRYKKTF